MELDCTHRAGQKDKERIEMKIKNITIGIKSPQQGLKKFADTLKSIKSGHSPKGHGEAAYFVDVETFQSVLTLKRIELLHAIHQYKPKSIYELAQLVKRNLKNVQNDTALLTRIGLISLTRRKEVRNNIIPRVDYDRLQVQIPV